MVWLVLVVVAVVALFAAFWVKASRERQELNRHSITADELHTLMDGKEEVLLYDVRQPLDFLVDLEIIPGARRISPKEIEENAEQLLPRDKELIVYCTCPSDKTSRAISRRAQARKFFRVKFLRGGLAAWKQRGYAVEAYREAFHLDTAR